MGTSNKQPGTERQRRLVRRRGSSEPARPKDDPSLMVRPTATRFRAADPAVRGHDHLQSVGAVSAGRRCSSTSTSVPSVVSGIFARASSSVSRCLAPEEGGMNCPSHAAPTVARLGKPALRQARHDADGPLSRAIRPLAHVYAAVRVQNELDHRTGVCLQASQTISLSSHTDSTSECGAWNRRDGTVGCRARRRCCPLRTRDYSF